MVQVVTTIEEVREKTNQAHAQGQVIGFVPTMGFLHDGHRSLIQKACHECNIVIVSIFVNPLQFGANEDLENYPSDLEADVLLCKNENVDIVFAPTVSEMYPAYPTATTVHVSGLTDVMCGAVRPGHFDGVTTVVAKLFSIVGESRAYFGRKDAQQLRVIQQMVSDLNFSIEIISAPTIRESDGLALSSRNRYLNTEERLIAPTLFRALVAAVEIIHQGERHASAVIETMHWMIAKQPQIVPEYIDIRDADSLATADKIEGDLLIALAAHIGSARLIDNVRIRINDDQIGVDLGVGWSDAAAFWRPGLYDLSEL